jgi:hypothetical protein
LFFQLLYQLGEHLREAEKRLLIFSWMRLRESMNCLRRSISWIFEGRFLITLKNGTRVQRFSHAFMMRFRSAENEGWIVKFDLRKTQ